MGLFVVARLAARHGIRVRLRPAAIGGLTALVWLPDEVITQETSVSPPGFRRFGLATPGADNGGSTGGWPVADDRDATVQALTAARTPRFTPLRPDLADTGSFGAIGGDDAEAAAAGTAVSPASPGPVGSPAAFAPSDPGSPPGPGLGASASSSDPVGSAAAAGAATPPDPAGSPSPAGPSVPGAAPRPAGPSDLSGLAGSEAAATSEPAGADAPDSSDAGAPAAVGDDAGPLAVFAAARDGPPQGGDDPGPAALDALSLPSPHTEPDGQENGVIVPPADSAGEENRLPIFESVESDWFRRGRHGADRGAPPEGAVAGPWTSPADEGWRAAETVGAPVAAGVTVAGLPKRVPKANLVPGGVGQGTSASPLPARSAVQARDRLSSFQRGMREGRVAAREDERSDGEEDGAT
jgi:hypothetical protein